MWKLWDHIVYDRVEERCCSSATGAKEVQFKNELFRCCLWFSICGDMNRVLVGVGVDIARQRINHLRAGGYDSNCFWKSGRRSFAGWRGRCVLVWPLMKFVDFRFLKINRLNTP